MITLKQAVEVLDAQVASGENLLNREVKMACGSDMMSDVGLCQEQGSAFDGTSQYPSCPYG